jgi:hypothetical protein
MSLPRPKDDPIEGAVAALIRRIARGPSPRAESSTARARAPADQRLDAAAVGLLEALPPQLRLITLRGQYPRLLNLIAAAWHDPEALEATIDSLVIDHRGGRQGFPFEVLRELTDLREYHAASRRRGPGR